MKKIMLAVFVSALLAAPVYGQSDSPVITAGVKMKPTVPTSLLTQFEKAKKREGESHFKYTAETAAIRREPDPNAEAFGQIDKNARLEVVAEMEGWAMIATADGYAYVESDKFSLDSGRPLPYTEEDLEILTRVLTGECQSYPDSEQLLVGSVVLNRVKSPQYPNTVKGVVFQKGQYSCTRDGNYYRTPTERNRANAKWLLENGSILPDNVVYQSGKRQGSGVYLQTRYHYFCYR